MVKKTLKTYKKIVSMIQIVNRDKEKFNSVILGLLTTTDNKQIKAWLNKQKK